MFERFTEPARRAVFFARYEAIAAGSQYIEPEHVLLGILQADAAVGGGISRDIDAIRAQVVPNPKPKDKVRTPDLPLSEAAQTAFTRAAESAFRLSHRDIRPAHLLLGILAGGESSAAAALEQRGVTPDSIAGELQQPAVLRTEQTPQTIAAEKKLLDQLAAEARDRMNALLLSRSPDGAFSFTRRVENGEVVVETHHVHERYTVTVVEKLRLSDDEKKLTFSYEIRGPNGHHTQGIDFDL